MKYLVTGTGRCGSVYMARLLTSLGYMCGHEAIFDYTELEMAKLRLKGNLPLTSSPTSRGEGWFVPEKMVAESSYMAAPFLEDVCLDNVKVIHIVRNPLEVISSHHLDIRFFQKTNDLIEYKKFVAKYLPGLSAIENPLELACYYYVHWNKMIEDKTKNKTYFFHRVEDKCSQKLLDFLEIETIPSGVFTDDKVNSWRKRKKNVQIKDIPNGEIKKELIQTMKRYGYIVPL